MQGMHLRQRGFMNSACQPFTKNKKRMKTNKETGNLRYIYQNELDKACFQHNMVYGDFMHLNRRTTTDKVLCDKEFNIAKNPKYDGYQHGLALMVYKFFYKNILVVVLKKFAIKN